MAATDSFDREIISVNCSVVKYYDSKPQQILRDFHMPALLVFDFDRPPFSSTANGLCYQFLAVTTRDPIDAFRPT